MDDELEMRLRALEDESRTAKAKAREDKFMDSYGSMFSGDRSLGLAIMNELDRRGIDTSAADEELQAILDELRTELNGLLGLIKQTQQQAEKEMDKVDAIADVVTDAVNSNPDATVGDTVAGMPPVEMPEPMGEMPAEGEFDPSMAAMPPAPPEPALEGAGAPPPMPPEPAPAEGPAQEGAPEGEPLPEEEAVSDSRMKFVKKVLSDRRAKRVKKPMYKPSSGIIAAARGGMS